jgi:hypothetical protein
MSDDDAYSDFLERVSDTLERAVAQFKAHESGAAVKALKEAVVLCENHPAFAAHQGDNNIASMQDVLEACIQNALQRRVDVGENLASLLRRIHALRDTNASANRRSERAPRRNRHTFCPLIRALIQAVRCYDALMLSRDKQVQSGLGYLFCK